MISGNDTLLFCEDKLQIIQHLTGEHPTIKFLTHNTNNLPNNKILVERVNKKLTSWKKGRGKLGVLEPLLGSWVAHDNPAAGKLTCTRTFSKVLDGNYIQLSVKWEFATKTYEELAIIGLDNDVISFWSFTSDGKKSKGHLADGKDVHPDAICFEAQMPAGIARMTYWPDEQGGFYWAVESMNKKGWNRFTEHHYRRL